MAKSIYKIPISLGRSILDLEINLGAKGWNLKPLPMKVILFWLCSIFAVFWLVFATFLKHANPLLNILLIAWWLMATAFLGKYSKTKELRIKSVPALVNYVTPGARRVVTRRSADPTGFQSIAGINGIDESGFITWNDGTVGQAYLVVGSASVLVFAKDKLAILDRVDAFYRKVDTSYEVATVTTKEPQRVYRQLANLERRNQSLDVYSPELQELLEEQHAILTGYVGGSFASIHQYFVVKADNLEALRKAHVVLEAEAEESALMIRQLTQLDGNDTKEMLRGVYAGSA